AVLPTMTCTASQSNITKDASHCATIPPVGSSSSNTCTITFSSTTACLAENNIQITGDNIASPHPTTALAFSMGGYLVFALNSPSSADPQVIDSDDLAIIKWGSGNVTGTMMTDGALNTGLIATAYGLGATSSAVSCYNSLNGGAVQGTWYLPALCQMLPNHPSCSNDENTTIAHLNQLGFINLSNLYWSSTQADNQRAWSASYQIDNPDSLYSPVTLLKAITVVKTRCVRTVAY
ncbi:MAG TPA: hypothetical protein VJL60_03340, partial [Gammaproteobacteria bacterium]|nr:hypothetical protein [Gammaproteobacteria bacterium]